MRVCAQGIDPALDPNQLELIDPRNPMNIRRRQVGKDAKHKHRCVMSYYGDSCCIIRHLITSLNQY